MKVIDISSRVHAYHPARWFSTFFLTGVLLPWAVGAAVWMNIGRAIDTPGYTIPGFFVFAATWNYVIACLIPPVVLMLVARTRNGPITWYRLRDHERTLFAKIMFVTFCLLGVILFALVWRANNLAIIPVMMTSFLPALVASLAGVVIATVAIVVMHRFRRLKTPPASYGRHSPA